MIMNRGNLKVTVKYTHRDDELGNQVNGFYVVVNEIPIGRSWKTYEAAYASMEQYTRDLKDAS